MKDKPCNVAFMYYAPGPHVLRVQAGFLDELNRLGVPCKVTMYDCNSNQNLIRSNLEDIIDKQYDLLFTFGLSVTVAAKELTKKKMCYIPVIFAGLTPSEGSELSESWDTLTGVAFAVDKDFNATERATILFEARPHVKKVGIPFDEDKDFLYFEADLLEQAITAQGKKRGMPVTVTKLPIKTVSQIIEKVKSFGNDIDVIILLRDGILASLEGIVKFCNLHGITVYTSELDSVKKGAGIGYGQDEYYTGVACADLAREILINKKKPRELPIRSFYNAEVHINKNTKDLQGLSAFDKNKAQHPLLKNARLVG